MKNKIITFIGAGNMAHSLIGGLIADGYDPKKIWVTNPTEEHFKDLKPLGVHTTLNNLEGAQHADILVFAIKPQVFKTVAIEVANVVQEKKPLIISVAAGVREANINHWLGNQIAIVRCMPNTPALIGCGATALYANQQVSKEQKSLAESVLRAVGITVWINKEIQLDAVTALSGCGPAYFFLMIEAMEQAGVELGLSEETAHLLTVQTALGASRMALESTDSATELRRKVASPGGSTERALQVLEKGQLAKLLAEALQAAERRSAELADLFGK